MSKEARLPDLFIKIDDLVGQSKLELLVKQNLPNLVISNLVSPPLIGLVAGLSNATLYQVLAWTLFGLILGGARLLHHQELANFQQLAKSIRQWEFELVLFYLLNGFLWSAACILFISPETPGLSIVIVATVFAHISASVTGLSTHPWVLNAFTGALWLPACTYFILVHPGDYRWFYIQIAILGLFFVVVNTLYAMNQGRSVVDSLRLRYENQHLLRELRQQKMIAENADLAKSRFLAAASHDLRQPLHAMGLFADSLAQRINTEDAKSILKQLRTSIDSLQGLLNSLLDISRLEAEVITPEYSTFNLGKLVDQLVDEYGAQAAGKNLDLHKRTGNHWVYSDPVLVEQILRNLIWNAIKYTEEGGVLVAIRHYHGHITVEVWDTGLGISPREQQKIFDEFHQVNNPNKDRSQGIGLGLSIVQRAARLLGLEVSLASRPGIGSRFSISFTTIPEPRNPPGKKSPGQLDLDLTGVSVMVVDDSEDIRHLLALRLKDWGCQVKVADSLKTSAELLGDFSPDILLTDFQLQNEENGNMIIDLVRESLGVDVPSIIITGASMVQAVNVANYTNVETLCKPVESRELREAMIKGLNQ